MPVVDYRNKELIAKEGWFKEAVYEELIERRDGSVIYRKWKFTVDIFPCLRCRNTEHVYVKSQPQGVYRTCMKHKITIGPLATQEGIGVNTTNIASVIEEKILTRDQAYDIATRLYDWGRRPFSLSGGPPV